jgi:hypothetical protein
LEILVECCGLPLKPKPGLNGAPQHPLTLAFVGQLGNAKTPLSASRKNRSPFAFASNN